MQYFVIWVDGSKFGPATVEVLNQWAAEGRINADTQLESVVDGSRVAAGSVPGLTFGAAPAAAAPAAATPAAATPAYSDPVQEVVTQQPARYFVIGSTGDKYGPADVATLQSWANEGRLTSTSQVEEEGTGRTMMAMSLPGITFAAAASAASSASPFMTNPEQTSSTGYGGPAANYSSAPTNYPRAGAGGAYRDEEAEKLAIWSIVLGGLSLFTCGIILSIPGLIMGNRAKERGAANAQIGVIINWISIGLSLIGVLIFIFAIVLVGAAGASGGLR